MAELAAVSNNGLDGIVVAETKISEVDGQRGKLIICGRDSEELAFESTFEETAALLWSDTKSDMQKQFAQGRVAAFELLQANPTILNQKNPMDAIRTATSF